MVDCSSQILTCLQGLRFQFKFALLVCPTRVLPNGLSASPGASSCLLFAQPLLCCLLSVLCVQGSGLPGWPRTVRGSLSPLASTRRCLQSSAHGAATPGPSAGPELGCVLCTTRFSVDRPTEVLVDAGASVPTVAANALFLELSGGTRETATNSALQAPPLCAPLVQ